MPNRKPKRPRDINALGVAVAKIATGEAEDDEGKAEADEPKQPPAKHPVPQDRS
jgi:hypothetical protein